ncbi:MAG: hypothetical protein JEZ08_20830 [Clostridiales bacterium]|nr:hypothetical protein [Clostridiales bacterium]
MNISGICLVTEDVKSLVEFYEKLFDTTAEGDHRYGYIIFGDIHFSFCSDEIEKNIAPDYNLPSRGGRCIIEIRVDDVHKMYGRALELNCTIPKALKTEVWGVTSFWVEDPEGNIISFLTPPKH